MEIETTAKVRFLTGKGNIDVELYAKELPLACKAFLQNCIDRKFVGLLFDRLLPDLVEVSPKTQENKIKREFHSRVKFTGRGCVALLNVDNTQLACPNGFFITMKPLPEFNNNYVIIGKVVGDLIFNVVKIQEAEKEGEKPLHPVTITGVEVLQPYFEDLVKQAPAQESTKRKKPKVTSVKLSYDEDEEDQGETFVMKSAHELLQPVNQARKKDSKEKKSENRKESAELKPELLNSQLPTLTETKDEQKEERTVGDDEDDKKENVQHSDDKNSMEKSEGINRKTLPRRDPHRDSYDVILDVWEDKIDGAALKSHRYECRRNP